MPSCKLWISFRLTAKNPGLLLSQLLFTNKPNKNLDPQTAVKKLTKILMISTVAKPLMELVPK